MRNPYEQPSRRPGCSLQRKELESQRSSSGSSEPPQDDPQQDEPQQDDQQEGTSANVQDDPMGEEVVDLWEGEGPPDNDYVVEQATRSSISASNPWVLYEAGIICAREEDGDIVKNSSGEKVIVL